MKKLLLTIVWVALLAMGSWAQAPQGFNYQAVIRDAGNTLVTNQAIGIRMTIQQGAIGGSIVYQEAFAASTNAYGLVNLTIGSGAPLAGDFTIIDWANGPYFIETAVDISGGTNYAVMGTSQLLSVPYALHAQKADSVINDKVDDADASPTNELQTIRRSGTTVILSKGGGTYQDSVNTYVGGNNITVTGNTISQDDNMHPFATINYVIALTGTFPTVMDGQTIGEIRMFAGINAPSGWAFCDGQLLSITTYPALFSILGTTYGGNGTTTFALPDFRGRSPIHEGSGPGLTNRVLGSSGGVE